MADWIWFNGEIRRADAVSVSVEDRGFQFADGVYEVIRIYNSQPFALDRHLQRLWDSAVEIQLTPPLTTDSLTAEVHKLLAHDPLVDGSIYLQLTRGVAERNHIFPEDTRPTLLFYALPLPPPPQPGAGHGVKLLSVPDDRWRRCWIKSTSLLANVLAKNAAIAAGADEAAFIDGGGFVTECSTSNLFAVVNNKLVTHPVGSKVLPGITRAILLELAAELEIEVDERAISEEEAPCAQELFITSTTREISWVSCWNDRYIGCGCCGPITAKLHRALRRRIAMETSSAPLASEAMVG